MDKGLIKNFVLRNNYYSFNINNYTLPKFIYINNDKKISLEDSRSDLLNRDKSFYEPSFIYDVSILQGKAIERKSLYNYIREFPIVIEDKELWIKILDSLDVDESSEFRDTNYFVLDFLFYESDFIVEIDSKFHIGKELYDKGRDIYLKIKYGLDTIRFFEYGKDDIDRGTYQSMFKKKIKEAYYKKLKLSIISGPVILDFSETIINNYIKDNKSGLLFIDSLKRYLGVNFFLEKSDIIELSLEQLHKISPKTIKLDIKYKKSDIEIMAINSYSDLLKDLYNKTIKIKNLSF